jgi:GxxExxY protein
MHTNDTNKNGKLIYPEISYLITGICFDAQNILGRYAREKQYCDFIEKRLAELKIPFEREFQQKDSANIIDFLIDEKVILETKAKRFVLKEDYYQIQRYLQSLNIKLGLLVNFRNRYIKPLRIIRIDTDTRKRFV